MLRVETMVGMNPIGVSKSFESDDSGVGSHDSRSKNRINKINAPILASKNIIHALLSVAARNTYCMECNLTPCCLMCKKARVCACCCDKN
jgi:hypothetical protein